MKVTSKYEIDYILDENRPYYNVSTHKYLTEEEFQLETGLHDRNDLDLNQLNWVVID